MIRLQETEKKYGDILLIDDALLNLELLSYFLKKAGYQIRTVTSGAAALKSIEEKHPMLILLDIVMPGMDGFEVCRLLKADEKTKSIPIIFISALGDIETKIDGFKLGAVDYIEKPFEEREVLARISTHYQLRQAQIDLTKQQVALKDSHKQLQEFALHLQSIREDERGKIARDIHDEIGQFVTGLKMELSTIKKKVDNKNNPINVQYLSDEMYNMLNHIDIIGVKVREIIMGLRPDILDNLGLLEALQWHAEEFQKKNNIKCTYISDLKDLHYDNDKSIAVFRIVQEALTNILKHAHATEVIIDVREDEDKILFSISDNGIGFSQEKIKSKKTMGLIGMRERAKILGGTLDLITEENNGTSIILYFPNK